MLEIYLPIVQVNIDIFLLLFLSLLVGVLSGLFGVGGGFLMTPFLIFNYLTKLSQIGWAISFNSLSDLFNNSI